ncbi:uncharacterized protein ARMOST_08604 [Armillaria ostoyae]|uniref:Uncharacterized protein n=1 Tax=Armillaria ostoyae TaxID=47428 RepID=A0A284R922_ARMOS|nr:uncharacterized protein ARMOST_08604 [Armillaria ostoyae]
MAITITLAEEHVEPLVQSVSDLVTQVEMQGGDASHYRALVSALMGGEEMVRDNDELGFPYEPPLSPPPQPSLRIDIINTDSEDEATVFGTSSSPFNLSPSFSNNDFDVAIMYDCKGAIAHDKYTPCLSSPDPLLSLVDAMDSDCGEDETIFGTSSSLVKVSMLSDDLPLDTNTHVFNNTPFSSLLKSTGRVVNRVATPFISTSSSARCISPGLSKTVSVTQMSTSPILAPRQICLPDNCADAPPAKRTRLNLSVDSDPSGSMSPDDVASNTHELASPHNDFDPDGSGGDSDGYVVHARLPGECEKRKGDKKQK